MVNYSFGFTEEEYRLAYAGTSTKPLIGPAYAPVRSTFSRSSRELSDVVQRVLITCGSTNPSRTLEKMTEACMAALPDARLDVVVGAMSNFVCTHNHSNNVVLHRGVTDLSSLMHSADMAVSAAGTTLYELCCMGVPTVALPIVENQMANAKGFSRLGVGLSVSHIGWSTNNVIELVAEVSKSSKLRTAFQNRMKECVDGLGTSRIVARLLGFDANSYSI